MEHKQFCIIINPKEANNQWTLYILRNMETMQVYHVGVCHFAQVMNVPDARRIQGFRPQDSYLLSIEGLYPTRTDAMKAQSERIKALGVTPQVVKDTITLPRQMIQCDQTGELFRTINEACQAYGLYASHLCNHLNRKIGYKTIHGRTFSRVPCPDVKLLVKPRRQ